MTQQLKKSKEINELMLERKNIENMIVNSKLWSPPFSGGRHQHYNSSIIGLNSTSATFNASDFTSNVFKGKKCDRL